MRVKVKNPNYGKKDLVSKASDAENEELPPLEEHWFIFPDEGAHSRSPPTSTWWTRPRRRQA